MPASHPALTIAQTQADGAATPTPSAMVIYDPLSGPKGSPLDVRTITGYGVDKAPIYVNSAATQNPSTGALSTGIGLSEADIIAINASTFPATTGQAIFRAGYNDNDVPGEVPTYAAGGPPPLVASSAINSTRMYIGGGRAVMAAGNGPNGNGAPVAARVSVPTPYTAGVALIGSGNGGSRDAGAGPAFTGFPMKMVTATGAVAIGAAVEAGWVNRAPRALVTGESVFGSSTAGLAAPS